LIASTIVFASAAAISPNSLVVIVLKSVLSTGAAFTVNVTSTVPVKFAESAFAATVAPELSSFGVTSTSASVKFKPSFLALIASTIVFASAAAISPNSLVVIVLKSVCSTGAAFSFVIVPFRYCCSCWSFWVFSYHQ
jgi:hypothetical protein